MAITVRHQTQQPDTSAATGAVTIIRALHLRSSHPSPLARNSCPTCRIPIRRSGALNVEMLMVVQTEREKKGPKTAHSI